MKQSASQKGFGTIGVAAIILVVAVIAFAGWYVWNKNGKDDTKPTSQATQNQNQPKPDEQKPADPTEGGKYLVISEWGVRFQLPEDLRGDVTYGIAKSTSSNKEVAWFEIGKLASLPGSNCKLTDATGAYSGKTGGAGVVIDRTTEKLSEDVAGYFYAPNIKIGDFWYSGGRDKYADSCVGNESHQQKAIDTIGTLTYSLDKLEAIPR